MDELRSILTAARQPAAAQRRATPTRLRRARGRRKSSSGGWRRWSSAAPTSAQFVDARARAVQRRSQGEPRSFDLLDALLDEQSYRLAHWRVASEEINYRRFFDVNELAALRMEDPSVFDEVHRFAFELVDATAATGLRVDHVDGLFAPGDYLRRLQARAAERRCGGDRRRRAADSIVVVEKILGADEQLPDDWPVHGTTGYEFAAVVNGLFVDRAAASARSTTSTRASSRRRERRSFDDISPTAARSRCCTRRCRATSTRSAIS